ncbi:RNA polymerase-associated protein RapA [Spongiibacter sp. KMU-158]|uniref:RNA polymerase-associated protein RapA n=1 Tax=Spongiibacter pelagi TaxID=2760804 RepID=A0A927C3G1_9GAMM|nr:RNA polymerase-associated protein RapA [Spongiibacter pelagi]MBD2858926.1 RNA polymerase-associated protein RapA [Spongiibacter pelagi]
MSEIFIPGQRWISNAEPDLGLGIILEAENRRVLIAFPASEEERTYAAASAPLSRVQYQAGDAIRIADHPPLTVIEAIEQQGCFIYLAEDEHGNRQPVPEQVLSAHISLSSAKDKLLAGQVEHQRRYQLRIATLEQSQRHAAAGSHGVMGPRVQLLPHQFYIAKQAAQHEQVRLLLADEVGLGKTIEAGLIVHQRVLQDRAKRILILVPETLVNQWLVEMLRRFNLQFSIFDEERCGEIDGYRDEADSLFYDEEEEKLKERNPFEEAQLILASMDWLSGHPRRAEQLCQTQWDMLVVDEAHNLHWQADGSSDAGYQLLEQLCNVVPSVLMLTATPENAGIEGHFARLRLLDPQRYPSLEAFQKEQAGYAELSQLIDRLQTQPEDVIASSADMAQLKALLDAASLAQFADNPAHHAPQLIDALLDRFGTGRSLFRNTRASIGGFPARKLNPHPLPLPTGYGEGSLEEQLYPERAQTPDWVNDDPRINWLEKFLLSNIDSKVLLICGNADIARDIELFLRLRRGIASSVFYEDMSLLERDRAAAYFADPEEGAQLLVCSEIGSEGRNFQFAEHLVLFDLPLNPDLLEQRIGRLDRIGRRGEVQIHTPYFEQSAQESLLAWYRDALKIFSEPCTIGSAIMAQYKTILCDALTQQRPQELSGLIAEASKTAESLREQLSAGRNRLLELNSCRRPQADHLLSQLQQDERPEQLREYLELLCDQFGVDIEEHSENAIILRPGEQMLTEAFPHLPEEGMTGTFDRERALSREDMHFLTWEHPLVHDSIAMIHSGDFGAAAVSTLPVKGLPAGTLLLEAYYSPTVQAPVEMQLQRFLAGTSQRFLIDKKAKDLSAAVSHDRLNQLCQNVKRKLVPALMRQVREELGSMVQQLDGLVEIKLGEWRKQAGEAFMAQRNSERLRLVSLAERNPDIGQAELAAFDQASQKGQQALEQMQLNLYGLRLAIVSQ